MEVEVPRGEIQCKIKFVGESKVEKNIFNSSRSRKI
jgi:hypothetical protein